MNERKEIILGTTPNVDEKPSLNQFSQLLHLLAKIDPARASRHTLALLDMTPKALTEVQSDPEHDCTTLAQEICDALPEGYWFTRGYNHAMGFNNNLYGIWPDESLTSHSDNLDGILIAGQEDDPELDAVLVPVDPDNNAFVKTTHTSELQAIYGAAEQLIHFGFRGKLRVLEDNGYNEICAVDLNRVLAARH